MITERARAASFTSDWLWTQVLKQWKINLASHILVPHHLQIRFRSEPVECTHTLSSCSHLSPLPHILMLTTPQILLHLRMITKYWCHLFSSYIPLSQIAHVMLIDIFFTYRNNDNLIFSLTPHFLITPLLTWKVLWTDVFRVALSAHFSLAATIIEPIFKWLWLRFWKQDIW